MSRCPHSVTAKRLLSVKDAVAEFGGTPWMWRSLIWDREIPFVEIGRKHFLDRQDVETLIEKRKKTA